MAPRRFSRTLAVAMAIALCASAVLYGILGRTRA